VRGGTSGPLPLLLPLAATFVDSTHPHSSAHINRRLARPFPPTAACSRQEPRGCHISPARKQNEGPSRETLPHRRLTGFVEAETFPQGCPS